MADIRKLSITANLPQSTPTFKIGIRVQVVNLVDGVAGPYHGCQGIVSGLFKTDDGEPAAKVMFTGRVEKKLLLEKLTHVEPTLQPVIPTPAPATPAPPKPTWAAAMGKAHIMVRGDQLQPFDIVYFTQHANPRELQRWLNRLTWKGVTIVEIRGMDERFPGLISIDPARWYVVERK